MMGHKICFYGEIWLIIPKLSLLPLLMWSTAIWNQTIDWLPEVSVVELLLALEELEYIILCLGA